MARYDDLNTNMIAYATVLSTVVLVLVLQGVQALTNGMLQSEDERKLSVSSTEPTDVKNAQLARLQGFTKATVADPNVEGATMEVFTIPIEQAEKLVLEQFATK